MFDSEKESLEEHVILLLIRELVRVSWLIRLHEIAKLIFRQVASISREPLHYRDKGYLEALLCLFVVFGMNWSFEKVDHKVGCSFNRDLAISFEMEEKSSENLNLNYK